MSPKIFSIAEKENLKEKDVLFGAGAFEGTRHDPYVG